MAALSRSVIVFGLLLSAAARAGPISPDDLGPSTADVIFLGEIHDNPGQHANQARAVGAMVPSAIVLEMAGPDEARRAAGVNRADADALAVALGWPGSGWPDFSMYHPIFLAAPDAVIYGAERTREEARAAMTDGAAAVLGPAAGLFGLDQPLAPAEQAAREADQMEAHCGALPEQMLAGMVEAQRLRDGALAYTALQAYLETGGPVAVITGNGHARKDRGAPRLLARADPDLAVMSIGQFEEIPTSDVPYDGWMTAPAPAREDPCAIFRQE